MKNMFIEAGRRLLLGVLIALYVVVLPIVCFSVFRIHSTSGLVMTMFMALCSVLVQAGKA